MKPQAVIVVGLQDAGFYELKLVQKRGFQAILFKGQISLQEAMEADVPVEVDLNNEADVIEKAKKLAERYDIKAVYTLNEYRVPLAARIKEALRLRHGLSYEAATNCRNKKKTRQFLQEYGVGSAKFTLVQSPLDAISAMRRLPLPVVIKPSNEAGSNFVAVCEEPVQVWSAVEAIASLKNNWVGQDMDREILMEEFLDGPEYSVEAVTIRGRTTVLAITAKATDGAVEVGHTVPAPLTPEQEAEITRTVQGALIALGVSDTVTHTEVKWTPAGARVIEVNARPGGDRIHQLVQAVTGYELRELSLHLALGGTLEDAPRQEAKASSAAIRFLTAPSQGTVELFDRELATAIPQVQKVELYVKNGDEVERTTSNYNRLGYFIVHGTEGQTADQMAAAAAEQLTVQVK